MSTTFAYRARAADGSVQRGELQAGTSGAAAKLIAEKGWVPLEIQLRQGAAPASPAAAPGGATVAGRPGSAGLLSSLPGRRRGGNRKARDTAFGLVLREMAALLRAGVPLLRGLQLAADSTGEPGVRDALRRIARDLDNGHNLAAAAEHERRVSGLISEYDIAMLQVGEQTGRLPEAFADLHRQREFQRATQERVGSALRYPAFVLLTCLAAVIVVNLWVIPAFAKVFAQAHTELPALTQVLMGMSNIMKAGWPVALVATVAGVFAWRRWTGQPKGRMWWDRNQLRVPIVGPILEGILLSRLSASLASSISAGLTLSDALTITGRTLDNSWFESRVTQMCADLARGTSITSAARNMGILPPTMLQLFAIGEESGSLEELMREIAVHYQAEVDHSIGKLSATLEPLLIWFLGMGVLVLALGIFMPMWDLGSTVVR